MLNIIKKNKLPAITFLILSLFPFFIDSYYLNNISYFMCWTFISLGLALIWGMGGVLSFGQTAFFGLAGYSFAVVSNCSEEVVEAVDVVCQFASHCVGS